MVFRADGVCLSVFVVTPVAAAVWPVPLLHPSQKPLLNVLAAHAASVCVCVCAGRVEAIAFNTLRELLVTCGADGRVVVMAVDSGKQVCLDGVPGFVCVFMRPVWALVWGP